MNLRGRIFAGDLVRALSQAGDPAGANWPAIARMLGFRFELPSETGGAPEPVEVPAVPRAPEPPLVRRSKQPPAPLAEGDIGEMLEFELQRSTAPPEAIPSIAPAPQQPKAATPVPLSPLFNTVWERGVLLEAAGTLRAEGEIAIVEALQLIARGEGWRELPVEKIQSVSKGCQVLVDAGLGMQPFASDTRQIVRSLRRTVGAKHVRVLTFVDCPTGGVLSDIYKDDVYRPPDNGATVVAISDLCAGGPRAAIRDAEPEAWLSVAKQVRDAASAFIVLNPYPPDRWPTSLVGRIPIVHWHRATRSADVRKARRRFRS
jgi:hypothetical protein